MFADSQSNGGLVFYFLLDMLVFFDFYFKKVVSLNDGSFEDS